MELQIRPTEAEMPNMTFTNAYYHLAGKMSESIENLEGMLDGAELAHELAFAANEKARKEVDTIQDNLNKAEADLERLENLYTNFLARFEFEAARWRERETD